MPYRDQQPHGTFIRRLNALFPGSTVEEEPFNRRVVVHLPIFETYQEYLPPAIRGERVTAAIALLAAENCVMCASGNQRSLTFQDVDFAR
jgi:hypothetical protein